MYAFFQRIINNNLHVLQTFLPESPEVQYHFRPRSHDKRQTGLEVSQDHQTIRYVRYGFLLV